jgi:hypothetical protein
MKFAEREQPLMKRLSLLLALVVVVTMIMIVSAMPAMAAKSKPTSSGGGGKGGYGVVVHQDKGGDDVYNKRGFVCNSCNND